jgi:hypothetical protein
MRSRDAFRAGYTRHEVDRVLAAPFWGIRSEEVDLSTPARCRQFLPRLPDGGFFSHATAAELWDLSLPPWLQQDTRLHVSVPKGRRAVDAAQIVGHQVLVDSDAVSCVDGLSVSAPARVWRELGTALPLADLVALGDELLRRARPLTPLPWSTTETAIAPIRGNGAGMSDGSRGSRTPASMSSAPRPTTSRRSGTSSCGHAPNCASTGGPGDLRVSAAIQRRFPWEGRNSA